MLSRSPTRKPAAFSLSVLVLTALIAGPISSTDASLVPADSRQDAASSADASSRSDLAATVKLNDSFGQLPLYFVENRGQADPRVAYTVLGGSTQVYFTADGVTFALVESGGSESRRGDDRGEAFLAGSSAAPGLPSGATRAAGAGLSGNASPLRDAAAPRQRWAVKLDFVGANPQAKPVGENRTAAVVSYFKGPRDQWHAGLPTYAQVVYRDLWPGIDLVYHGQAGRLKYDLLVHPGADPAQIRLRYRGAESVTLNAAGQLEVTTPLGGFTDDAPIAWQEIDGERAPVPAAFDLRNGGTGSSIQYPASSFGFSLGLYDRSQPLVIDPAVLVYCGYIGGSGSDSGHGIAVDGKGNVYVTGSTSSSDAAFPVAIGPDLTLKEGSDAFVAKIEAGGTGLVYADYIGGSSNDYGEDIAVDDAGNGYVTGCTSSTEDSFPATGGPDLTHNGGENDAFVAKVSASGAALLYAGYIGGSGRDLGYGIAVDGAGNAYVTGDTASTENTFPVAVGPDLTYNGGDYGDAFVAKVSPSGAALVYAGFIGGLGNEDGNDIAVDGACNAYVTGTTWSTPDTFPVIGGPGLSFGGGTDAFVAKVSPSGAALVYAGYIGGSGGDCGWRIAVDGAANAYVAGGTGSDQTTFPVTGGPDPTHNGGDDAFVAKVSASGTALVYAGYIGGSYYDFGLGIAVDGAGNAYVTGWTGSPQDSFPVTGGPDLTHNGGWDAFVAKVSASGAALVYAGYIGGSDTDWGWSIAVDSAGNAYVTGQTDSTQDSFPVTGGLDPTYNGGEYDVFVAKVVLLEKQIYLPLVMRGS
jgi:hypothetical protein